MEDQGFQSSGFIVLAVAILVTMLFIGMALLALFS
jgi:hypothetical protein